jgi:hypothetical protein
VLWRVTHAWPDLASNLDTSREAACPGGGTLTGRISISRSTVGYYRAGGAALSVPGTAALRSPSFHFDRASGDIHPIVIVGKRRFLAGDAGTESQR